MLTSADAAIIAQAFRDEVQQDEGDYAAYVPDSLYTRGAARAVADRPKRASITPAET